MGEFVGLPAAFRRSLNCSSQPEFRKFRGVTHLVQPLGRRLEPLRREANLPRKRLCLVTSNVIRDIETMNDLLIPPLVHLLLDGGEASTNGLKLLRDGGRLDLLRLRPAVGRQDDLADGAPVDAISDQLRQIECLVAHPYCLAMSSCLRELLARCSSTMFRLSSNVSLTFGRT